MNSLREMKADSASDASRAEALREEMIGKLWEMGAIRSDRVAEVFRAVDRRWYTLDTPLEEVYDPMGAVHVKWDEHGVPVSTVSSPQLQAGMLEQADIRPGMNVLEIGSGGVNAAMMSWLAGPGGTTTTVDIDPDVTDRARSLLDQTGYSGVNVVTADAENGVPTHAPYDRIIVTVGAWDIPPAWLDQLAPEGCIVVPLRMRGLTRSLALERTGDHLESQSADVCGFVKMQGAGANAEQLLSLRDEKVLVRFDDGWPGDQPPKLDGVLDTSRVDVWSGVTIAGTESFDTLQLWLATVFTGFGRLAAEASQKEALVDPDVMWFDPTAVQDDSVAYLTARRAGPGVSEFGVHAFGPHAGVLAEAMAEQVRVWGHDQRHGPGPAFAVWPKDAPAERLPEGLVIDKRHCRVTVSWPTANTAEDQGN
ncbi:methyltransferase, FxLD system [Saccharopolyspora phatthalungensis]|uniref:Protein-L-isoaspartate O-methyltransferase n=1 Tax=Saccharopolyspora phatthalungensis TaxID=664693 RepID=A0A840Q092_9PSEU|nr:methyltransferase, FxLD system [Saccharopolyspora phatthalungensis]MBB5155952.1 protein-L-isoaspartate(D-aspartate) O-methyltransferase [Saccharopolyspora phatthalungensis]